MKTLYLTLHYEPGEAHLNSIRERANWAKDLGCIKSLPIIAKQPAKIPPFWNVLLMVAEEDKPFWLGFSQGMIFSSNNREIALGIKEYYS